jgi:hypothetical protein
MAQNYTVSYSTDNVTFTTLSNAQNISLTIGRRALIDNYAADTCTIDVWYPTGYYSPIAAMVTGTFLKITNTTTSKIIWYGRISDTQVNYGIVYNSVTNTGNSDRLTIMGEGSLAQWGRARGNGYAMAAATSSVQIAAAATASGLTATSNYSASDNPTLAATTVSNSWADWFNQFTVTNNGRIRQGSNQITALSKYSGFNSTINFSDTTNNATNQVYDNLEFHSLGQNYFTQVTVSPESFTAQTVQTGASPYRNLNIQTFNSGTGQALDFANYLLTQYGATTFSLASVSCLAEAQNTMKLDAIGTGLWDCIGYAVTVAFRGTTYYAIIEGATFTADPGSSRYTYYLSGADLNSYLILDNVVQGRLDYNKLGY